MQSMFYDTEESIRELLAMGFEMPVHFVAMGTDGSIFAGTVHSQAGNGFDCRITIPPNPRGLAAPVNIMYVDCRGEAALVVLRPATESSPATG